MNLESAVPRKCAVTVSSSPRRLGEDVAALHAKTRLVQTELPTHESHCTSPGLGYAELESGPIEADQ
jgi:hypothetical protein